MTESLPVHKDTHTHNDTSSHPYRNCQSSSTYTHRYQRTKSGVVPYHITKEENTSHRVAVHPLSSDDWNHISAHAYACVYRANNSQFILIKRVIYHMHIRTHMRMHHKTVSRIVMYPLPSQYDTHPYAHTLTLLFSPANSPPRTPYAFKERSCSGRHQTGTAVCRIPLLQTVFPGRTHARKNKTHGSL